MQQIETGQFGAVIGTMEEILRDDPILKDMINGIPVRGLWESRTSTDFDGSKTFARRISGKLQK